MAQKQNNEATNGTTTQLVDELDAGTPSETARTTPTLQLRLEHPREERRVVFHDGVIDNEHLNRKKSKCCCIYKKPLAFDESSSEDDEDCEHCFGHPEKRKRNAKHSHAEGQPEGPSTSAQAGDPTPPPAEPVESPSDQKPPTQDVDITRTPI
ncbi:E3 ubiquitin-protein ligase PPP1R11 [Drosophila ficusphila]|uniref:E3 ubiquitin-protein ligase PPP1R11 n=1 Tax=Drosophila ficusphila TaxID=30025 RepID=UPI0007E65B8B|nr:E3 ubiquitin-protein ligase PPP1R11 [Drosophila ficusphila]